MGNEQPTKEQCSREMFFAVCKGEFDRLHRSIEALQDSMIARFEAQAKENSAINMQVRDLTHAVKDYNGLRGKIAEQGELVQDALGMAKDAMEYVAATKKTREERKMHVWKTVASGVLAPIIAAIMTAIITMFSMARFAPQIFGLPK